MNDSMPKLIVKRCCPPGNKMRCQLWEVQDHTGYGLGKFGTRTGALDFAHGRVNDRQLKAIHAAARSRRAADQITIETVIEVEEL